MPAPSATAPADPLVLELFGKLDRILVDEVSFSIDRSKPATPQARATISADSEVGITEARDKCFASLTLSVNAIATEENNRPVYFAKVKATGFYSFPTPVPQTEEPAIADKIALRAQLQVWPEVRRILMQVVSAGGYNVKIPLEPFHGPLQAETPAVAAKTAA
jgi:preprotein translocase subunit SecB